MNNEAVVAIGRDIDSPEIRDALQVLRSGQLPVRCLDAADIPSTYITTD